MSINLRTIPSKYVGRRNDQNRHPVDIGSGGGRIMASPFFLLKIPVTLNRIPSLIYLLVCAIIMAQRSRLRRYGKNSVEIFRSI
jgi:hypothetical protein